ncbi:MAG: RRXRR domain-containing protein [Clostridiales bacterium]|nr:RRXRR domain-containing protein [Clostridiales bacterium]
MYDSTEYIQPIYLGVDARSKTMGISATAEKEELYAAEAELRTGIVDLLSTRRAFRSASRNGKARCRKPRFSNRIHTKHKGWLAPSIENKIQTHMKTASNVHKMLPTAKIVVEVAALDIQKSRILIRLIKTLRMRGDAQNNPATLCKDCHSGYPNAAFGIGHRFQRRGARQRPGRSGDPAAGADARSEMADGLTGSPASGSSTGATGLSARHAPVFLLPRHPTSSADPWIRPEPS